MTIKVHTEEAFETLIVEHLTTKGGYLKGTNAEYDSNTALIKQDLIDHIKLDTYGWKKIEKQCGAKAEEDTLRAFQLARKSKRGVLSILRHGFKVKNTRVKVVNFKPATDTDPKLVAKYNANRVKVVRQVHHNPDFPDRSVDLVLFINGIPIVTIELKNLSTGQGAGHAVKQYMKRDPVAPLFLFKRGALVHFAVGSDEAQMTTHLERDKTFFLPFNRGHNNGKGNPPVSGKHRTHYIWEEVLQRDSLIDLVHRFLHLEVKENEGGKIQTPERMIFPRYHQLTVVRKLIHGAKTQGAGNHYLVQHSAGSGKSNSIAWLAHRLSTLCDEQGAKAYDSVVVISDRRILNKQLQDIIYQFEHKTGVVHRIDKGSTQLAKALEDCSPIIITTIHKFSYIADKIKELPDRKYAVIIDEAHGSQTGSLSQALKDMLGIPQNEDDLSEEEQDPENPKVQAEMQASKRQLPNNISYFAFTATPKAKTLALYGHKDAEGKYSPFHLYSMKQAIEENFILDVLKGYTSYETYFKVIKKITDDKEVGKKKAARSLARFVNLHPTNVAQKTEVIIEHFRTTVSHLLGGRAKGMVVTGSRLQAVKYKLAFDAYIKDKGYEDIKTLVAFSGVVIDPEDEHKTQYTEPSLNKDPVTGKPIEEGELPKQFEERFDLLIVASKYQTGFDQPLLCAMYLDRTLGGIQAVQTLSRLNRIAPGKKHTFVLNFVKGNDESILNAFKRYYEDSELKELPDPYRLEELKDEIYNTQIVYCEDVNEFSKVYFKTRKHAQDNAKLNALIDPAIERYKKMKVEEEQDLLHSNIKSFCHLYTFLSQLMTYSDVELEELYVYCHFLTKKLPRPDEIIDLDKDDVDLAYYKLKKLNERDLEIHKSEGGLKVPTGKSHPRKDDLDKLSNVIDSFNERFGTEFDVQDMVNAIGEKLNTQMRPLVNANNDAESLQVEFNGMLMDVVTERYEEYSRFIDEVFSNDAMSQSFQELMFEGVMNKIKLSQGEEHQAGM